MAIENQETTIQMRTQLFAWLSEVGANLPEQDLEYNQLLAGQRHNSIVNEQLPALEKQRLEVLSQDFKPNDYWWGSQLTKD